MSKNNLVRFFVAPCALAFGLSACSGDSGTSGHIDSGDEINIPISDKVSSSDESSGTSANVDVDISSSAEKQDSESSSSEKMSSSSTKVSSSSVKSSSSESNDSPKSSAVVESSSSVAKDTPASSASDNAFFNEGWREDCLAKINEYRATENLPPYTLASEEKQNCADKQSADDLESGKAHGHFRECGEFAQNSGPNFSAASRNATAVAESYLEMMWNEKKLVESGEADLDNQEDFLKIGHYKNMHSSSYTKVACGIALSADGKKGWLNVNFY